MISVILSHFFILFCFMNKLLFIAGIISIAKNSFLNFRLFSNLFLIFFFFFFAFNTIEFEFSFLFWDIPSIMNCSTFSEIFSFISFGFFLSIVFLLIILFGFFCFMNKLLFLSIKIELLKSLLIIWDFSIFSKFKSFWFSSFDLFSVSAFSFFFLIFLCFLFSFFVPNIVNSLSLIFSIFINIIFY